MQSLEESLKEVTDKNDELKSENQQLKEKILVLETEVNTIILLSQSLLII